MPVSRAMVVWAVVGLVAVGSLAAARLQGPPPPPDDLLLHRVRLSATRDGAAVTYSLTVENRSDTDLTDLYVAGKVPPEATFLDAGPAPAGTWFRGVGGAGTPQHAAAWLAERLPAQSTLGPFVYRLRAGDDVAAKAQGWVHWQQPAEGTAISTAVAGLTR